MINNFFAANGLLLKYSLCFLLFSKYPALRNSVKIVGYGRMKIKVLPMQQVRRYNPIRERSSERDLVYISGTGNHIERSILRRCENMIRTWTPVRGANVATLSIMALLIFSSNYINFIKCDKWDAVKKSLKKVESTVSML